MKCSASWSNYQVVCSGFSLVILFLTPFPQVVMDESKNGTLVIFIKDIEKSLSSSGDSFSNLKVKFDLIPEGVLVIASHTQLDNRKEKVMLFL